MVFSISYVPTLLILTTTFSDTYYYPSFVDEEVDALEVQYLAQHHTVCDTAGIQTQAWALNLKLYSLPGTL